MITSLLLFATIGTAQFAPAVIDAQPVRIEGGVTKVGYQVDAQDISKLFPWRALRKPVRGQGWIALVSGSAKPGRYWVQDTAPMKFPGEPDRYPGGQIVRVLKAQGVKLWLDEPFAVDIRGEPRLVSAPILSDVRLDGGKGPLSLSLVDGFRVTNWTVEEGWTVPRALSVQSSRNGVVADCKVFESPLSGPGQGYGCQVQGSVSVFIYFLTAVSVRHAGNIFGGANVWFYDSRSTYPKADGFETHNYGLRKGGFVGCDWGGSNASIGNKYPWGDRDVLIEDGRGIKALYCYGDTTSTLVRLLCSGPLVLFTNQAGSPLSVTAKDSTFTKYSTTASIHYQGQGPFTGTVMLQNVVQK